MKRELNEEQKRAVEETGGVLLEAGAGSGKTFVIVEHLISLIEKFLIDDGSLKSKNFVETKELLKKKLHRIVVMTFTRKATAEISIRVKERVQGIVLAKIHREEASFWKAVQEVIEFVNISTIHGFCYKIIKKGFLVDFDPDFQVVKEGRSKYKIEKLLKKWLGNHISHTQDLDEKKSLFIKIVCLNFEDVKTSVVNIFNDPIVRKKWIEVNIDQLVNVGFDNFVNELIESTPFKTIFEFSIDLSDFEKDKNKNLKWASLLFEIADLRKNNPDHKKFFLILFSLLSKYSRMPSIPKEYNEHIELQKIWQRIRDLKEFCIDHEDSFEAYFENSNSHFTKWLDFFKEIIMYIDGKYLDIQEFSFADLEYYVHNQIDDPQIASKIASSYDYFIVDEFQDTSSIQFSLIRKFIRDDFSKLYCVGDIKQAIYGFRGSELSVFQDCQKMMRVKLELKNNYRSRKNIIDFNNHFFNFIFNKGQNFIGEDLFVFPPFNQNAPLRVNVQDQGDQGSLGDQGHVFKIVFNISHEQLGQLIKKKLTVGTINLFEAHAIYSHISYLKKSFPQENIAVLYKNLGPSRFLISLLLKEGRSFTAQIKIPYKEDPIVGIFQTLIEKRLDKYKGSLIYSDDEYQEIILNSYLEHLKIKIKINSQLRKCLDQFNNDLEILGIFPAFKKLIFNLGITNSIYSHNMLYIEEICLIARDNIHRAWTLLKKFSKDKYSIEFEWGSEPEKLIIITAHSSKGLEFSNVILAGIHSNGIDKVDSPILGKSPGSFKWKLSEDQVDHFKSPYYILEKILDKNKNFSESKRLLYVACTRAKHTLSWIDFGRNDEILPRPKNSWILGFKEFGSNFGEEALSIIHLDEESFDYSLSSLYHLSENIPFFQINDLGITRRIDGQSGVPDEFNSTLGLVSELSVTKLAIICDCPRKFYLQNICGIDEETIGLLHETRGDDAKNQLSQPKILDYGDRDINEHVQSSKERGDQIHKLISGLITDPEKSKWLRLKGKDRIAFDWICFEIERKRADYHLHSERLIKFSFFGYMITGTPDLMLEPKSSSNIFSIWDFKTGQSDSRREYSYWFQLYSYAYGCYELNLLKEDDQVDVVIVYIDEMKFVIRELNLQKIKSYLFEYWKMLASLNQINLSYCSLCQYSSVCWNNPHILA